MSEPLNQAHQNQDDEFSEQAPDDAQVDCDSEEDDDGARIVVTVRDDQETTLAGVTVTVDGTEQQTNEQGQTTFEVESGQAYDVEARRDGHVPDPVEDQTEVLGPGDEAVVALTLTPLVQLTIHVVNPTDNDAAVPEAAVTVQDVGDEDTNDEGSATFQVRVAQTYDLSARKDRHAPDPVQAQQQVQRQNVQATLQLTPLVRLTVRVRDGLTDADLDGATVVVRRQNFDDQQGQTANGTRVFDVRAGGTYTVRVTLASYVSSQRNAASQGNVTASLNVQVGQQDVNQTVYMTVQNKILIIGEGTDFAYSVGVAGNNDGQAPHPLRQVIATQYQVTQAPQNPPDNLVVYGQQLDVRDDQSWQALAQHYGADFTDLEAILFNNPHVGYGVHVCMANGVRQGRFYSWETVHTVGIDRRVYRQNFVGVRAQEYDPNDWNHVRDDGTLPDYSTDPPTNRNLGYLFVRRGNYQGAWQNYNGHYDGNHTTDGYNQDMIRRMVNYGDAYVRAGGTLEVNASQGHNGWLTALDFDNGNYQFINTGLWSNGGNPFHFNYNPQLTVDYWHPSWGFQANNPPAAANIQNMRRYQIQK